MSSALSSFYGAQPLVVWVEDEATRTVLATAWAGSPIAIHIGGSNETIRAVVNDAARSGMQHVFGVVDRDFGRSNYHRWLAPSHDLRTYVLRSPEIENLALDPVALAACDYNTGQRSERAIRDKLDAIVRSMTWWMACCAVLAHVNERRNQGFPRFPGNAADFVDLDSTLDHIRQSEWFSLHAGSIPDLAKVDWLKEELRRHEELFSRAAAEGTWMEKFSGKQIFHRLSEFIHTKGTGKQKNSELLQAVIQKQVDSGTLADELRELRTSLRGRVGLPP